MTSPQRRILVWLSGILMAGILSGCNNNTLLRVQTDIPELALLADRYQAMAGNPTIVIEYRNPLTTNFPSGSAPDLLIGRGLYNQPALDKLSSQKGLFESDPLITSDFYSFSFIKQQEDVRLTVLSWDLPAIITRIGDTSQDFLEGVALPLDNLREKGLQFNTYKKDSLRTLGFSPLYAPEFMYLVAQFSGAKLGSDYRGFPDWNPEGLKKTIRYLGDWSTKFNGGAKVETSFIDKFTYDPVYQLLHQGRFSFAYARSSDFLRQPLAVSQGLSLHWPSWQDRLLILDNFVAAGIPRQASHRGEAIRFIKWLLQEEVQTTAIATNLDNGLYSFGFLQGFSSRRLISEKTIPFYFPLVRLRIPPDAMLVFPEIQGINWELYKKEVFAPWLQKQLLADSQNLDALSVASRQWLLHLGLDP